MLIKNKNFVKKKTPYLVVDSFNEN